MAKAKSGIPFLGSLFAELTSSVRGKSEYKDELRRTIKNSYSEFTEAFNQLIEAAQAAIMAAGMGKQILFIVDGTDRLSGEESRRFFAEDVFQLQAVRGNFIYCCPIQLLHEGNQVQQHFRHFTLPMIKLYEKDGKTRFEPGFQALRNMVLARADNSLFDSEQTLDLAIQYSGGNPRELLKILEYSFTVQANDLFDRESVETAIADLANDYKRFLKTSDYSLIYAIDQGLDLEDEDGRVNHLLLNLAVPV